MSDTLVTTLKKIVVFAAVALFGAFGGHFVTPLTLDAVGSAVSSALGVQTQATK